MENTIIEKIKNACANGEAIKIDHKHGYDANGSYGYEVKDNGDIMQALYIMSGSTGGGYGSFVYSSSEPELIGNCDDLSFLG